MAGLRGGLPARAGALSASRRCVEALSRLMWSCLRSGRAPCGQQGSSRLTRHACLQGRRKAQDYVSLFCVSRAEVGERQAAWAWASALAVAHSVCRLQAVPCTDESPTRVQVAGEFRSSSRDC